jgi:hypothetical protein
MQKEKKIPSGIYYVIPAQVFEDDRLEHSETVFYALLSGLSFSEGYCYASDKYLSDRMKVEPRTIKKWLLKLETFGYIKRATEKKGMTWDRKIYICHAKIDSSNCYERTYGSPTKGTASPFEREPQFPIVSKEREEEEEEGFAPTEEERRELDKRFSSRPSRYKPVLDKLKWERVTIKNMRATAKEVKDKTETEQKKGSVMEERVMVNRLKAEKLCEASPSHSACKKIFKLSKDFVSCRFEDGRECTIPFGDPEFDEKVERCKAKK